MIGLIEHGDLHGVEPCMTLTDQILQASRSRDDDVNAVLQGVHLGCLAHTAHDHLGAQAHRLGKRFEGLVDLQCEFACGNEDDAARSSRLGAMTARGNARNHRQGERNRLATARAAAAEHVMTGKGIRQGGRLNRESRRDAAFGEHANELAGDTQ